MTRLEQECRDRKNKRSKLNRIDYRRALRMTNYIARAGDPELDMIPDHDKYLMRELCRDLPLPVIAEKFEVDSLIVALVYLEGRDA